MKSFAASVHPRADPIRTLPLLRFTERQEIDALIFFGDITGPVLTDGEKVLYQQASELLQDAQNLHEKVHSARALLERPGLAVPYRDALWFYLSQIVDLTPEEEVAWQESYQRSAKRLREFAARLGPYPSTVLADTLICEEVFRDRLLDYDVLTLEAKTLKGVGLAPREGIFPATDHVPAEYRQELRRAVPFTQYLAAFDILVVNTLSPSLKGILERIENRLVLLPGDSSDVSDFEKITIAFEAPDAFSHYEFQDDRILRTVHRPSAGQLRLVRQDTFDLDFKLLRTKTDFDRRLAPGATVRRETPPPGSGGKHSRKLADILEETKTSPEPKEPAGRGLPWRRSERARENWLMKTLLAPIPNPFKLSHGKKQPQFEDLPLSKVIDNPDPLREHLDKEELTRLAQSIREFGVIVPIIVKRAGSSYQVVAGQRRLTAARIAGLSKIPAVVKDLDDQESAEVCYLENLHRLPLKPVEDAEAFERLVWELHNYTKGQLAKRLGLSPDEIKVHDEILRMPMILREAMSMGLLDLARARLLTGLRNEEERMALLRRVIRGDLSEDDLRALLEKPAADAATS